MLSQNCSLNKISVSDMKKENVCKYHNVGNCKYRKKCMLFHPTENCDKNVKEIFALKDTEKLENMDKIVNTS